MLTDTDRATLDLEAQRWKFAGAKEAAARETFGVSLTVHYARVGRLLDDPEALAYAPMTVRRLARLRDARRAVRTGSQAG